MRVNWPLPTGMGRHRIRHRNCDLHGDRQRDGHGQRPDGQPRALPREQLVEGGVAQEAAAHDDRGALQHALKAEGRLHVLVALAFERAAGVKFNHIPFSGGGPSVTSLLGGHTMALADSTGWAEQVNNGKARLLVTWGAPPANGTGYMIGKAEWTDAAGRLRGFETTTQRVRSALPITLNEVRFGTSSNPTDQFIELASRDSFDVTVFEATYLVAL